MSTFENQELTNENKRPTILLIFVILSLVWVPVSLISLLINNETYASFIPDMVPPVRPVATVWMELGSILLKLAGAILLLKMRKPGLFLYIGGELLYATTILWSLKIGLDWIVQFNYTYIGPMNPQAIVIIAHVVTLILSIVWIAVFTSQLGKLK